jgi:hypothetical protein
MVDLFYFTSFLFIFIFNFYPDLTTNPPTHRYILSLLLTDETGGMWVKFDFICFFPVDYNTFALLIIMIFSFIIFILITIILLSAFDDIGRYLLKTSADDLAKVVLESEQNINEAFKSFVLKPYSFRIKAKKNVNIGMSCFIWFIYFFNWFYYIS